MLAEPDAERILGHTADEGHGIARGQALLGLPGELRVAHLE
jgi:hypothetical protein